MTDKIKKNLVYVFCAGIGFLNFILLAFSYIASFYKYDYSSVYYSGYGSYSSSYGISGYSVMSLWELGFCGVISSLIQISVLILGIAMLGFGVMGLLKGFGVFAKFPEKVGKFESKKLGEFGLFGLAGLNVLLLVFLIILSITHTESYSEYGYSASTGIALSAGIFISLVFTAGAVVAFKIFKKKLPATAPEEEVKYSCAKCGKNAKKSDKFCNECGGEVQMTKTVVASGAQ